MNCSKLMKFNNGEGIMILSMTISVLLIFTSMIFYINNYSNILYYEKDKIPIYADNEFKHIGRGYNGEFLYETISCGYNIKFESNFIHDTSKTKQLKCSRLNLIINNENKNSKEFLDALRYESKIKVVNSIFWIGYGWLFICIAAYALMKASYFNFNYIKDCHIIFILALFIFIMTFSLINF